MTRAQKAEFLERWATVIEQDTETDGAGEDQRRLGIPDDGSVEGYALQIAERLRREAKRLRAES